MRQREEEKNKMPHLSNLNEDPALTNKLLHMFKPGKMYLMGFGNKNKQQYVGFLILFKKFLDGP